MDIIGLLSEATGLGLQTLTLFVVYVLWKKIGKLEIALIEAIQTGGKVSPEKVDDIDNLS